MAKKVKVADKRQPTKRQLARWEKEKKRQRIILLSAIVSIAVIVVLLGYGYFATQVAPWNQVIVDVNGTTFKLRYIAKIVRILGGGGGSQYTETIASYAPGYVRDNELVKQGTKKLGITASNEEIDQELRKVVLGSNPDEASQKDFAKKYEERLKAMQMTYAEYRSLVETEVLQQKYRASLAEKLPQKAEQVHVLGMLLTNNTVDKALERLKAGEDFVAIAKELSVDSTSKEKSGDLGWLPRGLMGDQFDAVAFAIEVGKLSDKIEDESGVSAGGYWIIKVTEKDSQRELDAQTKDQLVSKSFNSWLDEQRSSDSNKITINWDKDKLDWVVKKVK